jgi:hypothetical protein
MKIKIFLLYLLVISLSQLASWLQLNLQFLDNKWKSGVGQGLILASGVLVTWMYIKSVSLGVEAFDGEMWPQRLIQFAMGMIIYFIMTYLLFDQTISLKNFICLGLAITIVLVQVFVK